MKVNSLELGKLLELNNPKGEERRSSFQEVFESFLSEVNAEQLKAREV